MIRLIDTLTMASTKLRTRKVRTTFTVVIAGLLFSLVMAILFVSDGAFNSLDNLAKKSMTGRYIVGGSEAYRDTMSVMGDQVLVDRALARHKQLVADKKAEAKRLGIDYDASQDPSPVDTIDGIRSLSGSSPIAQAVIDEEIAAKYPARKFDDFKRFANSYQPIGYFETVSVHAKDGMIVEMKDGKEKFEISSKDSSNTDIGYSAPPDLEEATIVPKALLTNFLIPEYKWKPESGRIPVVVSQKRAAQITGFAAPKSDAPAAERLRYVSDLRSKANGATFTACYRNSVSNEQIQQAISVAKEIVARKNDSTYQKPSLIYATPDPGTCAKAIVSADTRSSDEKALMSKQRQFNQKFGEVLDPVQQKITYEVVGVAPNSWADSDQTFSLGLRDLVANLFTTQSFRLAIPTELYSSISNKSDYQEVFSEKSSRNDPYGFSMTGQFFAEFDNSEAARSFIKNESCQIEMSGCMPSTKWFMLSAFGSNSIAIDEVKHGVGVFIIWVTGIVTAIAALISGLTIGRTIADGRRETAVFRAIGFKRLDISQVYVTYMLMLCAWIIVFATVAGLGVAWLIHNYLWLDTTIQTQLAFGVNDPSVRFSYIGVSAQLIYAYMAVVLSGLIGMFLPLVRNIRRNPIRDMRDE